MKTLWEKWSKEDLKKVNTFCEDYRQFLSVSKTEREFTENSRVLCEKYGFKNIAEMETLQAGDKVYSINRNKNICLFVIGKKPLTDGMNILGAHIDSPRLDIKQKPLYETEGLALLDTHYYGGIKKYQWTTIPLSLHGVIVKQDGTSVKINIGEDENDPVFCVTDLLPHLATEQMKRPATQIVTGEELNIVIGSRPFKSDSESELVKLNILKILNEKYGITEDDFLSAELEAVPAFKAQDVGFDRSMIGSYGHDDRVCAYPALQAILKCKNPKKTSVVVLTDKEETGSDGNTGLVSSYLKYFIADLAEALGNDGRTVLSHSECMSADVNAGFDPTFPDVLEKKNASFLNYGVVVTKFTGARGKSGTSDASAEYVGRIRSLLNKNDIIWQTGELGKVDLGGGGTVAAYIANLNVDTIDVGVPVLSMHAPFEIVAKTDVYMAFRAFLVFLED